MSRPYHFNARYYDGQRATAHPVSVALTSEQLLISHTSLSRSYPIQACTLQAALGDGMRIIDLPDHARLETEDAALDHHWPDSTSHHLQQWRYWAENHWYGILLALAGSVAITLFVLYVGVPYMTRWIAMQLPASVERSLGKHTLRTLENPTLGYFKPSQLSLTEQQAVESALQAFCQKTSCPPHRLLFKASPLLGPNAFAIPGGTIVITDPLVKLAKQPQEIVAVLAHEMGHLQQRHALRQAMQATLSGLAMLTLTGDVSAIAAGLPVVLMNTHYSREMEHEADAYALQHMAQACIPAHYFATLLLRLAVHTAGRNPDSAVPEMLSSHPNVNTRVQSFLQAAPCQANTGLKP